MDRVFVGCLADDYFNGSRLGLLSLGKLGTNIGVGSNSQTVAFALAFALCDADESSLR